MTTQITARARRGMPLAPAWLSYEIRHLGWLSFALPCLVLAIPVLRLEYLFLTTVAPDVDYWLANRGVVLATGIALAALAGVLSTMSELHARGEAA